MKQYLDLLKNIKENGTNKPAARQGMPGSRSYFGYQFRHNLQGGFPLLTTKKMFWKGIVTELLWFLKGDTNIKYLVDNGVNIWNEDAYNYYIKKCKEVGHPSPMNFESFINSIKNQESIYLGGNNHYKGGDCGFQYGRVWRDWEKYEGQYFGKRDYFTQIDQIANVINSLKTSPEGRRHIVTAIDPAHQDDLALYWCHALFQFNCRPISYSERMDIFMKRFPTYVNDPNYKEGQGPERFDENLTITYNIPKYYLDCQLYQRSADAVLGVPFNIASYALLTHIIAKIVNMVPGEFIHTFGDVHIYDNHWDAVEEQLSREPRALPTLKFSELMQWDKATDDLTGFFDACGEWEFDLQGYNPHPAIKAELSTGLIK